MNLYVYYRVRCEHAVELQRDASLMQQDLSKRHGVAATLQRRPESKDGRHTWMETYQNTPDGFDAILVSAIAATGLGRLIDGERHTEYFVSVSSCA